MSEGPLKGEDSNRHPTKGSSERAQQWVEVSDQIAVKVNLGMAD